MHNLLETYLSELTKQIGALPTKCRNEEMREIRVHLENAILANRNLGQGEEVAIENAIAQFGTPGELAASLVWAWRRGAAVKKRSLLEAATATVLVLWVMSFLMNQNWYGSILISVLPRAFILYCGKHQAFGMGVTQLMLCFNFGLAGGLAAVLFPKQAVRGACLGLAVYWIGWIVIMGTGYGGFWSFFSNWPFAIWTLSTIAFAWAGSRWRLKSSVPSLSIYRH